MFGASLHRNHAFAKQISFAHICKNISVFCTGLPATLLSPSSLPCEVASSLYMCSGAPIGFYLPVNVIAIVVITIVIINVINHSHQYLHRPLDPHCNHHHHLQIIVLALLLLLLHLAANIYNLHWLLLNPRFKMLSLLPSQVTMIIITVIFIIMIIVTTIIVTVITIPMIIITMIIIMILIYIYNLHQVPLNPTFEIMALVASHHPPTSTYFTINICTIIMKMMIIFFSGSALAKFTRLFHPSSPSFSSFRPRRCTQVSFEMT